MERMENNRLVKKVYQSDVEGFKGRDRPRKRWVDGVREASYHASRRVKGAQGREKGGMRWCGG